METTTTTTTTSMPAPQNEELVSCPQEVPFQGTVIEVPLASLTNTPPEADEQGDSDSEASSTTSTDLSSATSTDPATGMQDLVKLVSQPLAMSPDLFARKVKLLEGAFFDGSLAAILLECATDKGLIRKSELATICLVVVINHAAKFEELKKNQPARPDPRRSETPAMQVVQAAQYTSLRDAIGATESSAQIRELRRAYFSRTMRAAITESFEPSALVSFRDMALSAVLFLLELHDAFLARHRQPKQRRPQGRGHAPQAMQRAPQMQQMQQASQMQQRMMPSVQPMVYVQQSAAQPMAPGFFAQQDASPHRDFRGARGRGTRGYRGRQFGGNRGGYEGQGF